MKKLSSLLNEKVTNVQWLQDSLAQVWKYRFPLTTSIAKELGIGERIIVFHFTSPRKAPRLISMQGSEKSISTMTMIPKNMLYTLSGIYPNSGILYKIEGTVVLASQYDILSKPDQRGRRWVDFKSLVALSENPPFPEKEFMNFLRTNSKYSQLRSELIEIFERDNLYPEEWDEEWDFSKASPQIKELAKQFISLHFDLALQFAKIHKNHMIQLMSSETDLKPKVGGRPGKHTNSEKWNEIVVNNIKLLEVVIDAKHEDLIYNTQLQKKIINSVPKGKALVIKGTGVVGLALPSRYKDKLDNFVQGV